MFQNSAAITFREVVRLGSFKAAAASVGVSAAAVSKQIASLEERIGAQLLQRTTRSMHLTEIGKEFYARCARIAEEAAEAERAVASLQGARARCCAPCVSCRAIVPEPSQRTLSKRNCIVRGTEPPRCRHWRACGCFDATGSH